MIKDYFPKWRPAVVKQSSFNNPYLEKVHYRASKTKAPYELDWKNKKILSSQLTKQVALRTGV